MIGPRRGVCICARALLAALLLLAGAPLRAQLQTTEIEGSVLGTDDAPARARVVVLDRLGAVVASTASGDDGRFLFRGLPRGDYWIRAEAEALRSALVGVHARDAAPG